MKILVVTIGYPGPGTRRGEHTNAFIGGYRIREPAVLSAPQAR